MILRDFCKDPSRSFATAIEINSNLCEFQREYHWTRVFDVCSNGFDVKIGAYTLIYDSSSPTSLTVA